MSRPYGCLNNYRVDLESLVQIENSYNLINLNVNSINSIGLINFFIDHCNEICKNNLLTSNMPIPVVNQFNECYINFNIMIGLSRKIEKFDSKLQWNQYVCNYISRNLKKLWKKYAKNDKLNIDRAHTKFVDSYVITTTNYLTTRNRPANIQYLTDIQTITFTKKQFNCLCDYLSHKSICKYDNETIKYVIGDINHNDQFKLIVVDTIKKQMFEVIKQFKNGVKEEKTDYEKLEMNLYKQLKELKKQLIDYNINTFIGTTI